LCNFFLSKKAFRHTQRSFRHQNHHAWSFLLFLFGMWMFSIYIVNKANEYFVYVKFIPVFIQLIQKIIFFIRCERVKKFFKHKKEFFFWWNFFVNLCFSPLSTFPYYILCIIFCYSYSFCHRASPPSVSHILSQHLLIHFRIFHHNLDLISFIVVHAYITSQQHGKNCINRETRENRMRSWSGGGKFSFFVSLSSHDWYAAFLPTVIMGEIVFNSNKAFFAFSFLKSARSALEGWYRLWIDSVGSKCVCAYANIVISTYYRLTSHYYLHANIYILTHYFPKRSKLLTMLTHSPAHTQTHEHVYKLNEWKKMFINFNVM
jgi:hypothetical protein